MQKLRRHLLRPNLGRTLADDRGQHKPHINSMLYGLLCSGVTLRRSAKLLKCSYNTIRSRLPWLANKARGLHAGALASGSLSTSYILFDEMQSFEHSAAKQLTIAVAVRHKTGQILSIKVGKMTTKGYLAAAGRAYGWGPNESPLCCLAALGQAGLAAKPACSVACDAGGWGYPGYIKAKIPHAEIKRHPRLPVGFDPLFKLNHVCAKIRADVSRLARKTWATTKARERLQDALDLYVAWNNNYAMG